VVLMVWACPAREVLIDITDRGIGYVINACTDGCTDQCCHVNAGTLPTSVDRMQIQLLLVEIPVSGEGGAQVRARSPCMQFRLGCDFGGSPEVLADCLAVQIDGLIAEAIPEGLGFDDLEDPSDVAILLAFHRVLEPEQAAVRQCLPEDLFACAGLTERPNETYDITCASCNGSRRLQSSAASSTVAPCWGACFIQSCHAVLVANPAGD